MIFFKKYPIPITGLILSLFTLGNIFAQYKTVRNVIGLIGIVLYLLYLIKIFVSIKGIIEECKNPIPASVFLTFTMSTVLLATYIKPYSFELARIIWIAGILGHILLAIVFSIKFLLKFSIKTVFASWYIVYVGMAVGAATAPAMKMLNIGRLTFWIGLVGFIFILPLVCYRVWKVKGIPQPAQPTLVIMSAPASLLLAGYLNSFEVKNIVMVYALLACSIFFYCLALYYLVRSIKKEFNPAYSAYTFPLVISALAIKLTAKFLGQNILKVFANFQICVSSIVVAFVLVGYLVFIFSPKKNK